MWIKKRVVYPVVRGLAVATLGCASLFAGAQSPSAAVVVAKQADSLKFDVASVKQNKSNEPPHSNFSLDSGNLYSGVSSGDSLSPMGGYFSATNQPLWKYISFAYTMTGTQELAFRFGYFAGLAPGSKTPNWVIGGFDFSAERFDIQARAEGSPTKEQMRAMMQALLAERFGLAMHHEMREAPVFALVLVKPGKMGPRLRAHPAEDTCTPSASTQTTSAGGFPAVCGVIARLPANSPGRVTSFGGRNVTLALVATSLPTQTGMALLPRPVVDATGLTGMYDFTLEFVPPEPQPSAAGAEVSGPSFAEALKEQLGVKLEPQKGLVDLIVLDHVEHPSEN